MLCLVLIDTVSNMDVPVEGASVQHAANQAEKHTTKKLKTSPSTFQDRSEQQKNPEKQGSPTHTTTTTTNTNNNNNNNINDTPTRLKDSKEEEILYHKRTHNKQSKQAKNNSNKDNQPSWGTRLRTHPKPVVRFGSASKDSKDKDSDDEEGDGGEGEELTPSMQQQRESDQSSPPSPHPSHDTPLEDLMKQGSGWVCFV